MIVEQETEIVSNSGRRRYVILSLLSPIRMYMTVPVPSERHAFHYPDETSARRPTSNTPLLPSAGRLLAGHVRPASTIGGVNSYKDGAAVITVLQTLKPFIFAPSTDDRPG